MLSLLLGPVGVRPLGIVILLVLVGVIGVILWLRRNASSDGSKF